MGCCFVIDQPTIGAFNLPEGHLYVVDIDHTLSTHYFSEPAFYNVAWEYFIANYKDALEWSCVEFTTDIRKQLKLCEDYSSFINISIKDLSMLLLLLNNIDLQVNNYKNWTTIIHVDNTGTHIYFTPI